jgi:tetratricopeptide (TPR) repeat protein
MSDKSTILAEARRQAEEELAKKQKLVSWYIGTVMVFAIFSSIYFFISESRSSAILAYGLFAIFGFFYVCWEVQRRYLSCPRKILEAFEKEPQDAADYAARAGCLYDYEFYEAAAEDYRTSLEMEPNNDLAWYDLAETLWRDLHRGDEALPIVEKLGKTEGDYQASALVFHGEILAETDPKTAQKCFDKAVELEPNDFDHHLARLRFYFDADRLDYAADAVAEIKQQRFPQCTELCELRGVLAMKQGRPADAVKELTQAIRFDPTEEKYYRLRSDAHETLGNHDKADADRQKAEELTQ